MNKLTKSLLSLAIAGAMTIPAAALDISVQLDGNYVDFPDAAPEITNSRTMVPFRAMAEAMGYTVGWDDATHRVTAEHDGRTLSFLVGDNKLLVRETPNSEWETLDMDVAPYINLDRTYVPVRFFAEAFGQTVKWDDDNKTAVIYDEQGIAAEINKKFTIINQADAKEKAATGSKVYMSYSYGLPDSDKPLALITISSERGNGSLYELSMDFSNYLEKYGNFDELDSILSIDDSVSVLFGRYDGMNDVEIGGSDEVDPDFGYSNGVFDFIGEDGLFNMSMISNESGLYIRSKQFEDLLAASGETLPDDEIWLKLPVTETGAEEASTLGEMLFDNFDGVIATEIVSLVKAYADQLEYISDPYFTKTADGWTLNYSKDGLVATGNISSDFSVVSYNVSKTGEDNSFSCDFWSQALDYASDFEVGGLVIDLTEIDMLG